LSDTAVGISQSWRRGADGDMRRRRWIVGLSVFSCGMLGGIALFQTGILKSLPDPPLRAFDANAVHGSPEAYALLGTPDALLGMASYGVTACLAGMGAEDRSKHAKWIPLAMGAKALVDAVMAAQLGLKQATKVHKYSIWSLLVLAATMATLSLAMPETRRALARSE